MPPEAWRPRPPGRTRPPGPRPTPCVWPLEGPPCAETLSPLGAVRCPGAPSRPEDEQTAGPGPGLHTRGRGGGGHRAPRTRLLAQGRSSHLSCHQPRRRGLHAGDCAAPPGAAGGSWPLPGQNDSPGSGSGGHEAQRGPCGLPGRVWPLRRSTKGKGDDGPEHGDPAPEQPRPVPGG